MRIMFTVLTALFSVMASASTGFHIGNNLTKDLPSIYVISTGWYYPVQAVANANPRGLEKTAELFGAKGPELKWTSQYGSASQTVVGREFPMSGVNEKGLMIQATVLANEEYPSVPRDAYGLQFLQWIQYHLDTSATLQDVIAKSVTVQSPILPTGDVNLQYQVCDLHDCAVFSFFQNKAVAQGSLGIVTADFSTGLMTNDTRRTFPLSAITNYTYADNIAAYNQCKAFPCPSSDNVIDRFNKAAQMLLSYQSMKASDYDFLLDDALTKIKAVDQGLPLTTWNEAYLFTSQKMLLTYKTPSLPVSERQWIDFSSEKFDCAQPVKMWWLDMKHAAGDQSKASLPMTMADQEKLARQHTSINDEATTLAFIAYPAAKTRCVGLR